MYSYFPHIRQVVDAGADYIHMGVIRLAEKKPPSKPLSFGDSDILKLSLTTREGSSAKRPHQAFLLLKELDSGLDLSYPLSVKESGKAKVELVSWDISHSSPIN